MPANLEIRFVEDGSASSGGGGSAPATPAPSAPGPGSRNGGGNASDGAAAKTFSESIAALAKVFGVGGLYDASMKLVQAFRDLANSARSGAKPSSSTPGARPSPAQTPKPGTVGPDGIIEGEYEVVERGLSIPGAPRPRVPTGPTPPSTPTPGAPPPAAGGGAGGAAMGALAKAGLIVGAVAATVYALKLFGDALASQAEELAKYSGDLASSVAVNEIRDMEAEMRRAERIGPDLAGFNDEWNKVKNDFYDLGTEILAILLKILKELRVFNEKDPTGMVDPYLEQLRQLKRDFDANLPPLVPPEDAGPGQAGGDW